ncbi:MAG TPA: malto-oligosyltrehalose synthase [Candidatus Gastranaerophilales bacterium]|nr:malto-oligosyltrehalose synthase [Candidatus Gastranaerophilales bacterium]
MDKHKILKKLAVYYGLINEYTDKDGRMYKAGYKEYQQFLESIGINTENSDDLLKEVDKIDFSEINRLISPVEIAYQGIIPAISLVLKENDLNKSFEWFLQEEGGKFHHGEFYASHLKILETKRVKNVNYVKIRLSLPIFIGIGYHNLKIRDETGKEETMKLIIVPKTCYKPLAVEKNNTIKGIKFCLNKKNPQSDFRISTYTDLKTVINYAASQKTGIIGVNSLNQFHFYNNEAYPEILSSRIMYNIAYIDIDELIKFIDDRQIRLNFLTEAFQEDLKKIQESKNNQYKAIYELKIKFFKIIYSSFRENHINKNTQKSRDFFYYLSTKRDSLRKSALFEAIKEYLISHDPKLEDWQEWPENYKNPNSETVLLFEEKNIETLQFYEFLQWVADLQLSIAGITSWIHKLDVGIYTELPFFIPLSSSESWLKQDYYAVGVKTATKFFDENSNNFAPLIPYKLKKLGYKYISEILVPNMTHSGAIKIKDINSFEKQLWTSKKNLDAGFFVKYPAEELIGILSLESHRNKCLVIVEKTDDLSPKMLDLLERYGFLHENSLDIKEIGDEESSSFFESIYAIQKQKAENKEITGRIGIDKTPLALYRLQFNKNFTFKQAKDIIPYLKELGISHCYASPLLRAREGSMHGYDIINHSELNPEIGSLEDFYEFVNTLHKYDMGLIMDIVPNHMGINKENLWWMDVLENGQASIYASFFDIDWEPIKKELKGKLLVPILGDHYGNILQSGQLKFHFIRETGKLMLSYWEHEFPINPSSYPILLEHRLEVLKSRLGSANSNFIEYLSIITEFKKIPSINETASDKITERNREKTIASNRLASLCTQNSVIEDFINENIIDFEGKPNDPVSCNRIHNFLEEQVYRLAYWRVSIDVINYRRFFDVNDLIGLKTENPLVFTSTHSLILDLIQHGKVDGLRLDHPDGLLNPYSYFKTLQVEAGKRLGVNFDASQEKLLGSEKLPVYVVAEKILAPFEKIPKNWAISGVVGYEFLNQVCKLFVDSRNSKKFSRIYQHFIDEKVKFNELVIECKKLIMKTSLTSELSTLANHLNRISEKYYSTRDYTLNNLRDALSEIIACFPVYRTYISEDKKGDKAFDYIKWAIGLAKKAARHTDPSIFDFLEKILLAEWEEDKNSPQYVDILRFAMKFQQYTAPLMAKGLEDTCFYRYNKLIALNDVGGEPSKFGISVNEFHNDNTRRFKRTPLNLLTTSTHDTKRSEDLRARICALSEVPEKWQECLNKWSAVNESRKTEIETKLVPDKNDEYLFYQILLGLWSPKIIEEKEKQDIIQRIEAYMVKALREAKVHTSWVNINKPYEDATCGFIRKILTAPDIHPFWKEFIPFHANIASSGYLNSLFQTALKLTCPGIPEIYQGNELLKFNLVDPDNRKPIDYNLSKQKFDEIKHLINIEKSENINWHNELLPLDSGKMKLFLTSSILNFRGKHQDLFRKGNYIPLEIKGYKMRNVVAFARQFDDEAIITIVPRFVYHFLSEKTPLPVGKKIWENTNIVLPETLSSFKWKDILTAQVLEVAQNSIEVGKALKTLPIAVLYSTQ